MAALTDPPTPPLDLPSDAHLGRLEQRLLRRVARASRDHDLLLDGDRVMVCLSGGKDSYVMWHLLERLRTRVPFHFDLVGVHLDQHQPGFDSEVVAQWLETRDAEYRIVSKNTYAVVVDKTPAGKAYCSMCSRLRRGILYDTAVELGCTRIALGHHRDDTITTLLMNLLYSGQIKAMPPRLTSDDGRNTVIRPLIRCSEDDIRALAEGLDFPIQPCSVCSTQPDLKRAEVERLIESLAADNPHVRGNLFAALGNVVPSHLMDPSLYDPDARADAPSLDALESGCGFIAIPLGLGLALGCTGTSTSTEVDGAALVAEALNPTIRSPLDRVLGTWRLVVDGDARKVADTVRAALEGRPPPTPEADLQALHTHLRAHAAARPPWQAWLDTLEATRLVVASDHLLRRSDDTAHRSTFTVHALPEGRAGDTVVLDVTSATGGQRRWSITAHGTDRLTLAPVGEILGRTRWERSEARTGEGP